MMTPVGKPNGRAGEAEFTPEERVFLRQLVSGGADAVELLSGGESSKEALRKLRRAEQAEAEARAAAEVAERERKRQAEAVRRAKAAELLKECRVAAEALTQALERKVEFDRQHRLNTTVTKRALSRGLARSLRPILSAGGQFGNLRFSEVPGERHHDPWNVAVAEQGHGKPISDEERLELKKGLKNGKERQDDRGTGSPGSARGRSGEAAPAAQDPAA